MAADGWNTDAVASEDVLFPYARTNLRRHLIENWNAPSFLDDYEALRKASEEEAHLNEGVVVLPAKTPSPVDEHVQFVIDNVTHWMDRDRKVTALKQLQGRIWHAGYASKELQGHVYPDVRPCLETLSPRRICVFSSGSVAAQKLIFGNSTDGDLTPLFSNYFDTNVGPKTEEESYKNIASSLAVECERVLFLTDVEREAYPARQAGLQAILVVREGNEPLTEKAKSEFRTISSFAELSGLVKESDL